MARATTKRCAVYTRKSSDEGLEQDYNSLDAQRDAGEAFIRSQKHEGWKLRPQRYDDGGISGGHMERPGLRGLLEDIRGGKIDVVVVYKVDRLSRSLADFARLMDLFDEHEVSFVSVTQQFNTSSSMGRLTLNVLLWFAQFEREVTGERIRDKIALSKKKGKWMGGMPPLGYDARGGRLEVNRGEVAVVRACFETYLASRGLVDAVRKLNQRGLTTKAWTAKTGRVYGGKPWAAKVLHRVLTMALYRGLIHHAGEHFEGEHEAIIEQELWDQVQDKLRRSQPKDRRKGGHRNEVEISRTHLMFPLKGFVFGFDGAALSPTQSSRSLEKADGTKEKIRYRYYVSQRVVGQGAGATSLSRLNAGLLEDTVRRMLAAGLPELASAVSHVDLTTKQIKARLEGQGAEIGASDSPMALAELLQTLLAKIIVWPERIELRLPLSQMEKLIGQDTQASAIPDSSRALFLDVQLEAEVAVISLRVSFKKHRGRAQIVGVHSGEVVTIRETKPEAVLIRMLAQAEFWRSELCRSPGKSLNEVVKAFGVQPRHVRRTLNAAYLAPEIKRAIFQGTQPPGLQVQDLIAPRSMDWEVQKEELGFATQESAALAWSESARNSQVAERDIPPARV